MGLYDKFETDSSREQTGVELDYGDGVIITIARAGGSNTKYKKTLERLSKPFRRQLQTGTASNEQLEPVLRRAYATSVVLGWEGVTDREGNPLEFSVENCMKLFEDLPDLFEDIQDQASRQELFRVSLLEADAKNS